MFGIPVLIGAEDLQRTGGIWEFLGNATSGPVDFAVWGLPTTVPLILGSVVVCAVGVLLGRRSAMRVGRILALVLLPVELLFWAGFRLRSARRSGQHARCS